MTFTQVIICTDGLANKGVGNLDGNVHIIDLIFTIYTLLSDDILLHVGLTTQDAKDKAQSFYEDMGDIALDQKYG